MKKMIIQLAIIAAALTSSVLTEELSLEKKGEILSALKKIKTAFVPDRKAAVFSVTIDTAAISPVLSGEVDNAEAKAAVMKAVSGITNNFVDSIRILPDSSVGERCWAITRLNISHMRSKPEESAELSSQVLMGRVVKVLKKRRGWHYAQSPDGYLGWMWGESFVRTTKDTAELWKTSRLARLTAFYDHIYEKRDMNSSVVTDISAGGLVKLLKREKEWSMVELPDGRSGYLRSATLQIDAEWKKSVTQAPAAIEKTARLLTGVTYLWGGASVFGVDCSGFTKTVFGMHGIELLRDADQQATMGEAVDPGENFENVKKGDLLFFGSKATEERPERVTHVAIALENRRFIHSSGFVRENSLDPASPIYDEYHSKGFLKVRRFLQVRSGAGAGLR